jgi:hypothetical protein
MRFSRPALVLLALGACGPAVRSAAFRSSTPAPRPADAEVRVYQQTRPTCAFQEIGWVSGSPRSPRQSADQVLDAMRARAMGGDAIIGFAAGTRTDGGDSPASVGSTSGGEVFTGTVVRFTDAQCTH